MTGNLPVGWRSLEADWHPAETTGELGREIKGNRGHPLYGVTLREVAANYEDDVLFELQNHNFKYACVHLTWNTETRPQWPHTAFYESLSDRFAAWSADEG